jgi:hypothetical protein
VLRFYLRRTTVVHRFHDEDVEGRLNLVSLGCLMDPHTYLFRDQTWFHLNEYVNYTEPRTGLQEIPFSNTECSAHCVLLSLVCGVSRVRVGLLGPFFFLDREFTPKYYTHSATML